MLKNAIGVVVCRIGAVLLFAEALRGSAALFMNAALYAEMPEQLQPVYISLAITVATPAVAGLLLAVFAESIAGVGSGTAEPRLDAALGRRELVSIGTYLIGIYVLVFGVVDLLRWESYVFIGPALGQDVEGYWDNSGARTISMRVAYAGQIVLGALLIAIGRR